AGVDHHRSAPEADGADPADGQGQRRDRAPRPAAHPGQPAVRGSGVVQRPLDGGRHRRPGDHRLRPGRLVRRRRVPSDAAHRQVAATAPGRRGSGMTVQETPDEATEAPAADSTGGLVKSSAVMALGTVASRLTGFLRVTVIMAALGSSPLSNAYNTANNAPYSLYELLLGGVLSAVLVPTFVRANKHSEREGNLYAQRLLTLVVLLLLVLTAVSVVGAPLILDVIANQMSGEQREIAIAFLR